jgi:hypothetical protein
MPGCRIEGFWQGLVLCTSSDARVLFVFVAQEYSQSLSSFLISSSAMNLDLQSKLCSASWLVNSHPCFSGYWLWKLKWVTARGPFNSCRTKLMDCVAEQVSWCICSLRLTEVLLCWWLIAEGARYILLPHAGKAGAAGSLHNAAPRSPLHNIV